MQVSGRGARKERAGECVRTCIGRAGGRDLVGDAQLQLGLLLRACSSKIGFDGSALVLRHSHTVLQTPSHQHQRFRAARRVWLVRQFRWMRCRFSAHHSISTPLLLDTSTRTYTYPLYTHTYTHGGKEPGAKPAERREARQVRHTKVQTGRMSSRATQGEEAAEQKSETSCRQPYDRVGKQQPRLSPHLHLCPVPHCVSVGMHITCHVYFFICQFAMPPTDPTEIDSRVRPVSRHMASEIMASG